MKRKMIGMMAGALLLTLVCGTPVWATADTPDDAVRISLDHAGVADTDAAVYKKVWEYSDGRPQYEINFLIPGQTKYEYEIDAMTGDILQSESEAWEKEDDAEYSGLTAGYTADPEGDTALIQEAVQTALEDAGQFGTGAVVYRYGLDFENGKKVVAVGFFIPGQTKYEYDIDAETGAVVTHEQEAWESDDDQEFKGLLGQ